MPNTTSALLDTHYLTVLYKTKLYNSLRLLRETIQRPEQSDAAVLMTFPIYFNLQDRWDIVQSMLRESTRYVDASLFRAVRSFRLLYTFPDSTICSKDTAFPFDCFIGKPIRIGILPMAFWRPSVIYHNEKEHKKRVYYLHQVGIIDCAVLIDTTNPDTALGNSLANVISMIRIRDLCIVIYAPNGGLGINSSFLEYLRIRKLMDCYRSLSEKKPPATTSEVIPHAAYDAFSEKSKFYPYYPREIFMDCLEQVQKCLFDSCTEEEQKKSLWPAINVLVSPGKLKFELDPCLIDPESYSIFMNDYTPLLISYDAQSAYRIISEYFKQMLLKSISEQQRLISTEDQTTSDDVMLRWIGTVIQEAT